jgi:hypothetical protein
MVPPSDPKEKRRLKFQNLIRVRGITVIGIPATVHLLLNLLPPPRSGGEAELICGGHRLGPAEIGQEHRGLSFLAAHRPGPDRT